MHRLLLIMVATAVFAAPASAQFDIISQNRNVNSNGYLEGPSEFIKGSGDGESAPDNAVWSGEANFSAGEFDGLLTGSASQESDLGVDAAVGGGTMTASVMLSAETDVYDESTTFGYTSAGSGFNVVFTVDEPSEWSFEMAGSSADSEDTWGFARLVHYGNPIIFDYDLNDDPIDISEGGVIMPGTYEIYVVLQVATGADEMPATGEFALSMNITTVATPVEATSWAGIKSEF